MWAGATLCSSRATRMIGPYSVLSFVMLVGLVVATPFVVVAGVPDGLGASQIGWLGLAGGGNVAGLLLAYTALRTGKVAIVAPILSTEGAIAAVISVVAGERLGAGSGGMLVLIAAGILLASVAKDTDGPGVGGRAGVTALLSVAAALCFGASLYATGRVGSELGIAWAVLPARLIGVGLVAVPLALSRRIRLTRRAAPLVVLGGLFEVGGFALFTIGARHGLAVSAVLSSQFAAIAAIAAFFVFRERLGRIQLAGVVAIAGGVAALSALQG